MTRTGSPPSLQGSSVAYAAPGHALKYEERTGDRRLSRERRGPGILMVARRGQCPNPQAQATRLRKLRYLVFRAGSAGPARGSASPTETRNSATRWRSPQDPTDETAHSGTLVTPVKGTENSRSAASVRVSWAVGVFPGKCSRGDKTPEKRQVPTARRHEEGPVHVQRDTVNNPQI